MKICTHDLSDNLWTSSIALIMKQICNALWVKTFICKQAGSSFNNVILYLICCKSDNLESYFTSKAGWRKSSLLVMAICCFDHRVYHSFAIFINWIKKKYEHKSHTSIKIKWKPKIRYKIEKRTTMTNGYVKQIMRDEDLFDTNNVMVITDYTVIFDTRLLLFELFLGLLSLPLLHFSTFLPIYFLQRIFLSRINILQILPYQVFSLFVYTERIGHVARTIKQDKQIIFWLWLENWKNYFFHWTLYFRCYV